MKKNILKSMKGIFGLAGIGIILFFHSCVEPYTPSTEVFEQVLVVESFLTSELKHHQVKLSETYRLEDDTVSYVTNANVKVLSDKGERFDYFSAGQGIYLSVDEYRAEQGVKYQLEIEFQGKIYRSDEEEITGVSNLTSVEASRAVDDDGVLGVAIQANSNSASGDTKFYRYTYEETYKIVSPYTSNQKFITDENGFAVLVDVGPDEEREICYNTLSSKKGVLSNTNFLNADNQEDVLIKFIPVTDKKILNRYSILVSQLVISGEAYRYFETLEELSNSESVFSQNQPGFLNGNIMSVNDPEENVVGYFEVASVSKQRIFFNFTDVFNSDERPDPTADCEVVRPLTGLGFEPGEIDFYVSGGLLQYLSDAPPSTDPLNPEGPYNMVPVECIDCRSIGTPIKPDFWIEENEN